MGLSPTQFAAISPLTKLYISIPLRRIGGGSNTFAHNFERWAKRHGHQIVLDIATAERAFVIAHKATEEQLERARQSRCRIVHRLDEHFEPNEDEYRRQKHAQIIALNRYADVTVFQSQFVFENVYPHIKPQEYCIIHNGSDPKVFRPPRQPGQNIGHVTWGVGDKKRLDLLFDVIERMPNERFWLVGRHQELPLPFRQLPNVVLRGQRSRRQMPEEYRRMKMLFFPSENDPCSNTVIEAILSGVPVCYHNSGGTPELVKDCGEPLENLEQLLSDLNTYRSRCRTRTDLHFSRVAERYMQV